MRYFKFSEFFNSPTAQELGILNYPTSYEEDNEVKANIECLVDKILDPIREHLEIPIRVTSGYRCPDLNRSILGSRKSQHLKGQAADIVGRSDHLFSDNIDIAISIIELGDFDQLILEKCDRDFRHIYWIHVSYVRNGRNRCQILIENNGSYRSANDIELLNQLKNIKLQTYESYR